MTGTDGDNHDDDSDDDNDGRGPQPGDHALEAQLRWGNTPEFAESQRRVRRYGPSDWAQLRAEGKALLEACAQAMRDGVPPDDERAMDLAELKRDYNCRWFYELPHAMHVLLAEGYTTDPRFRATYDAVAPGLADWVAAAIRHNAARAGASIDRTDALAELKQAMGLLAAPVTGVFGPDKEQRRAQTQQRQAEAGRQKKR